MAFASVSALDQFRCSLLIAESSSSVKRPGRLDDAGTTQSTRRLPRLCAKSAGCQCRGALPGRRPTRAVHDERFVDGKTVHNRRGEHSTALLRAGEALQGPGGGRSWRLQASGFAVRDAFPRPGEELAGRGAARVREWSGLRLCSPPSRHVRPRHTAENEYPPEWQQDHSHEEPRVRPAIPRLR